MDNNVEQKKVSLPESITLGGITYTVKDTPELLQFMQDVAKVEKTKLYSQYENLRNQIANLGNVQVTPDSGNIDAVIEKMRGVFITKDDLQNTLKDSLTEVVKPILTATEQTRKEDLDKYREKLIHDNAATCIPDLVKGNTKEELDKTLAESIRLRASYPSPSTVDAQNRRVEDPLIKNAAVGNNAEQKPTQPQPTPPMPIVPPTPDRVTPPATGNMDVKKMSQAEFAAQREKLMQQLSAAYGNN